ncbi:hypothetical protein [Burkholderia vietnamiensis]|uniref:hypothetical protein n=1 Tax=Burkholderia vietnamiensis TaxID=60552 RepID=UPI001CF48E38|nr:hypothetical protein [Burkholderia vietnamiensis]MCA8199191.1 hypothetical protein [Burkholderia vietnamiensis]
MFLAGQLRPLLRSLLLPIRTENESACGIELARQLHGIGIATSDFSSWIGNEVDAWQEGGQPSTNYRNLVSAILIVADSTHGAQIADNYFAIHRRLVDMHLMSHFQATAFLSHISLIVDLAKHESLSSAQIARLLARIDPRVGFSRQSIATTLQAVRQEPRLSLNDVQRLFARDKNSELKAFADANLNTAIQLVSDQASLLGFVGHYDEALSNLLRFTLDDDGNEIFSYVPYLQILHYQCIIADHFDHAVTDLYEFNPRGQAAGWLFEQYPPALATAGNPFLNNAKSVERLGDSWARSKKPAELPGAVGLVSALAGMEVMTFAARRELARWTRLLLHRLMRLKETATDPMPAEFSEAQITRLLGAVAAGNTGTFGILEQRVLDALASTRHPLADGWRVRGIRDSVNATNLSQRKLGDVDFQHASSLEIVAYEAHGGHLSGVYINEHLRTLRKALVRRREELSGIAEIERWSVNVVFVAHSFGVAPPGRVNIDGMDIDITAITFANFIAESPPAAELAAVFDTYVRAPLAERRTPHEVRQVVNATV